MPGTDNFDFDLSAQTAFEQMATGGGMVDPTTMAGLMQSAPATSALRSLLLIYFIHDQTR